jgi:nicotinate-nucleotide pyrophosphorylase (carboxylating)
MLQNQIDKIIISALEEDINYGDITTDSLITKQTIVSANLIAKEKGIIAGIDIFSRVFQILDEAIQINSNRIDGDKVEKGDLIAVLKGDARTILKGERTALNILQRMSGIATMTNLLVEEIKETNAKLVDTRKTIPNMRGLDKYAVRIGGGYNHRYNLSDSVLIKDNHIRAVGSIQEAVSIARNKIPHTMKIEVETETLAQVKEAITAKADIIMLDNMNCEQMKEAVLLIDGQAITEASGNISISTVKNVALTGVDVISCGGITHSVKALDISLKF